MPCQNTHILSINAEYRRNLYWRKLQVVSGAHVLWLDPMEGSKQSQVWSQNRPVSIQDFVKTKIHSRGQCSTLSLLSIFYWNSLVFTIYNVSSMLVELSHSIHTKQKQAVVSLTARRIWCQRDAQIRYLSKPCNQQSWWIAYWSPPGRLWDHIQKRIEDACQRRRICCRAPTTLLSLKYLLHHFYGLQAIFSPIGNYLNSLLDQFCYFTHTLAQWSSGHLFIHKSALKIGNRLQLLYV